MRSHEAASGLVLIGAASGLGLIGAASGLGLIGAASGLGLIGAASGPEPQPPTAAWFAQGIKVGVMAAPSKF